MSLATIMNDVAAILGINTRDSASALLLRQRINDAAKELWEANDLIGAMKEITIQTRTGSSVIALPQEVGAIRGIKTLNSFQKVENLDQRSWYKTQLEYETSNIAWRNIGTKPFQLEISNAGPLKFSFPKALKGSVVITVTGRTLEAARVSESLGFSPSSPLIQSTTNSWEEVFSIVKSEGCEYDCQVTDLDGNILSIIPNNFLTSSYTLYQIYRTDDVAFSFSDSLNLSYFSILYKQRYVPFVSDEDEFLVAGYNEAIKWKTLSTHFGFTGLQNEAVAAEAKANTIIISRANEAEKGKDMRISFDPHPLLGIFQTSYPVTSTTHPSYSTIYPPAT